MSASENIETNTLNWLSETIKNAPTGLDPAILSRWYDVVEADAKVLCPSEELRESITVVQNPILPMKFEFKSSKRAIPFVVEAIERNLNSMPFATRLYFQKFEEIIQMQLTEYLLSRPRSDESN
jgi:hypothetical protein